MVRPRDERFISCDLLRKLCLLNANERFIFPDWVMLNLFFVPLWDFSFDMMMNSALAINSMIIKKSPPQVNQQTTMQTQKTSKKSILDEK
jgi:hypothetical protein